MEITINHLAVLIATLSTLVVGSIWYTPKVFGNSWIKLAKLDPKELENLGIKPIIITVFVSLISAYMLACFSFFVYEFYKTKYSFLTISIVAAFSLWLGFTATRMITHDAFEGRSWKLTGLNISHELVTFAIMGLIIGLFGI
jgi:hypothetical protein